MQIVKLTTPWPHDYYNKTPQGKGNFGVFRFEIDNEIDDCDFWIVWGDLRHKQSAKCPPENIFYLTDEAHSQRKFNPEFLEQFPNIITQRSDIRHEKIFETHDLGIWHFPATYDELSKWPLPEKKKNISAISSDLTILEGHKKRFAFINKLMGHYKQEIDFYGRGISPIVNKAGALLPYKYSIAIENSYLPNYFTEKLFECFLCFSMPIYYGCPNLEEYFDNRSFVRIDIDDFSGALAIIDDIIKYDVYRERLPYILEARRIYLEKYFVFPSLVRIISSIEAVDSHRKKWNSLVPEKEFGITKSRRIVNFLKKMYEGLATE